MNMITLRRINVLSKIRTGPFASLVLPLIFIMLLSLAVACSEPTPTPTPVPTPTPTPTATPVPTPTPEPAPAGGGGIKGKDLFVLLPEDELACLKESAGEAMYAMALEMTITMELANDPAGAFMFQCVSDETLAKLAAAIVAAGG